MYPFDEFLSSYDEIHALWYGLANVVRPSHYESEEEKKLREEEGAYYVAGEIVGQAILGGIALVVTHYGLKVI